MSARARAALAAALAALLLGCAAAEDFPLLDPPEDGRPDPRQQWPPDRPSLYLEHKPKARAGVMVARYVPHSKLPPGVVLPFANITYRIVGADMTMANYWAKRADFETVFRKLYGGASLHAKILEVKAAKGGAGTSERPCRGGDAECCLEKGALTDPETWSALDMLVEVGCSRESLWPDQGSVDWAHARMLGTHLHTIGVAGRCLLQRADVLEAGVHAHKYLPITALYTEETVLQFTGHSLARWLPVDTAVQNLILHSMDLMGLNRIAGCARIRITRVSQRCSWDPGRGQTGVANITFVTHREYPETTLPMAFAKSLHVLLERLNEEGLNIAKIEVVANRPVQGPEWGNMHDQIAAFLPENETVRTYETRVPVEQLPNYHRPQQLGPLPAAAAAATGVALLAGLVLLGRRRSGAPRHRTVPLSSVGGNPDALDQMPHLRDNLTAGLPSQYSSVQRLLETSDAARNQGPAAFNELMARLHAALPDSQGADRLGQASLDEVPDVDLQAWPSLTDSPNPFLADAALQLPGRASAGGSGGGDSGSRNFGTIPAATLLQLSGSHDAARSEAQRAEQSLRRQQLRERGVAFEQQLARADSVAQHSWVLSDGEIEICLNDTGKRWLLGSGSYGKVYRGVRGGVQDVAVKVLQTADEIQISQFCLEIKLLKSLSFDRNIVQFMGVCLHSGNPMLVLEFMEGGDLRQRLSAPDHARYLWHADGQKVALDIVRGLHFLHTNRVVHSDLKSRNVLLARDGQTAKLSDVGMSRILSGSRSSLVHAGDGTGTFPYAAPELLMGVATTLKVDIYSLGVLIWEICTHEHPRRGQDRELDVPQECPATIQALVAECKHHDPDKRPTAREVFDRIRLAGSPQVGATPSLASSGELSQGMRGSAAESPLPSRDGRQQQPAR